MFAFELCRELGYAHPDFLLADLTYRQFRDWVILHRLEPFGELRADLRMARIAARVGLRPEDESKLLFRWKYRDAAPATPEDYRLKAMRAWAGAGGGMVVGADTPGEGEAADE